MMPLVETDWPLPQRQDLPIGAQLRREFGVIQLLHRHVVINGKRGRGAARFGWSS